MNYENLVQAGKTCITKLEGAEVVVGKHRLTLGRLALEACGPPTGSGGQNRKANPNSDSLVSVKEFAEAIGFSHSSLADYRKVAHQWAAVPEAEQYSWAVLTLIADADDKETILANTVERFGRVTVDTLREYTGRRTTHDAKLEQARAEATAEAEAKAAEALAKAVEAEQKKAEKAAAAVALKAKQDLEAAAIAAREKQKEEDKEKTRKALAAQKAEFEKLLAANKFDPSTYSPVELVQLYQAFQKSPALMEKANTAILNERKRKLEEETQKAEAARKEQAEKKADKEQRKAEARAKQAYEASALKYFVDKMYVAISHFDDLLDTQPTNLDHILSSKRNPNDLVDWTVTMERVAVRMREQLFEANATGELASLGNDETA